MTMRIVRHPELAADIRDIASYYAEVSERVLNSFWSELDLALFSIRRNPRSHHFDSCGLRRANLSKFPYHLLYEVNGDSIYLLVLRHDRRHPSFGLDRRS
jgi:plasmid stabilization system protein ParE